MCFDQFCNCCVLRGERAFSWTMIIEHGIPLAWFLTPKVNWELMAKERALDIACAKVDLDASKLNVQGMVQTMFGPDNREKVVDPKRQTTRLTSSMLLDKGPITSDVCFPLVRTAAEKREAKKDEDAQKRQAR